METGRITLVEAREPAPSGAPSWPASVAPLPEVEHLAFRYRLMPTAEQERMFERVSGCGRWVYNQALELCLDARARGEAVPSVFTLHKQLPVWKQAHPFLREPPSHTLQAAIADLGDGWSRFFKGQNDAPTWRRFGEQPSFRLKDANQFLIRNLPCTKKRVRHLYLPKMGMSGTLGPVAFVQHRPIEGKVKHLTITRDGGMWFVSFSVERKVKPEVHAQRARVAALVQAGAFGGTLSDGATPGPHGLVVTGVDRNTPDNGACVTNWGQVYGARVVTPERVARFVALQRVVARKEEAFRKAHGVAPGGSLRPLRERGIEEPKALREARADLAAFHGYVARCRKDLAHKAVHAIVAASDVVGVEALATKEMTAKPPKVVGKDLSTAPEGPVVAGAGDVDGGCGVTDAAVAVVVKKKRVFSKKVRKDILDAGWAMTGAMLGYKAQRAGKVLVRVDPAYTSQGCAACGHVAEENRNGKVFRCVACGHKADADVNAGWNIRARTLASVARAAGVPLASIGLSTKVVGERGVEVVIAPLPSWVASLGSPCPQPPAQKRPNDERSAVGSTVRAPGGPRGRGEGRKRSALGKGATIASASVVHLPKVRHPQGVPEGHR